MGKGEGLHPHGMLAPMFAGRNSGSGTLRASGFDRRLVVPVGVNVVLAAGALAGLAVPLLALAVAVPLGLALVQRPQRGLLLLAALMPFHGLLLIAPLPGWATAWKEALVLATLAATFVAPRHARSVRRPIPGWCPAVIGLLVASGVSAGFVGGLQAFWGLKIAFFFVLVAVIVWRCPPDASERDRLVTIVMVTGLLTALYGIAQQVIGPTGLRALGYEYNTAIRFTGSFLRSISSFNQPFGFGFFMMLVLILGVTHALAQPSRLRSRLFLLVSPVLVLALGFSFVRGAWIGLAAGLGYVGLTRFRVLLLGVPVVVVAALLLPADVASAAFASSSGVERVELWQTNLSRVMAHPLGNGVGSSSSASEKVALSDQGQEVLITDNLYYKWTFELGVIGLWMLILLLVSSFSSSHAVSRRGPPTESALASATAAMVLAAAVASTVATYFDIFPMDAYFWLFLGLVATADRRPVADLTPARP